LQHRCERRRLARLDGGAEQVVVALGLGLGLHPDFATAVAHMTRIGKRFTPEAGHAATYEQLYRKIYCRMYRQLQPLYHDIQKITGYPSMQ